MPIGAVALNSRLMAADALARSLSLSLACRRSNGSIFRFQFGRQARDTHRGLRQNGMSSSSGFFSALAGGLAGGLSRSDAIARMVSTSFSVARFLVADLHLARIDRDDAADPVVDVVLAQRSLDIARQCLGQTQDIWLRPQDPERIRSLPKRYSSCQPAMAASRGPFRSAARRNEPEKILLTLGMGSAPLR